MHCKSHQCKNDPRGLPEVREAQVEWLVGSVQAGQEHAARRRKTLPGNSRRYGHTLSQNQIRDPFLDEGFLALNAADQGSLQVPSCMYQIKACHQLLLLCIHLAPVAAPQQLSTPTLSQAVLSKSCPVAHSQQQNTAYLFVHHRNDRICPALCLELCPSCFCVRDLINEHLGLQGLQLLHV